VAWAADGSAKKIGSQKLAGPARAKTKRTLTWGQKKKRTLTWLVANGILPTLFTLPSQILPTF
jgi:hypothetical protein